MKKRLKEKGWSDKEIRKAERILKKEERHDVYYGKVVFWSALIVIIFANLLVSLILIPFLIVLNQVVLYSLVAVLAATIGFLYNFLITDIGHLKSKHHIIASIIIPILALINFFVMVFVSNQFILELQINNQPHNPWIMGIVFAVAFILPSIIDHIRKTIH